MALSYLSEGEAPRDFRVSSTESDGHYTKCLLCYTVKRNFYCPDCIKNGNFIHSSMPYSDRYSEKQVKLHRLKVNRKYVLDRCEKLLANKLKKDKIITEAKQSRDKIDLLRLAIEQRRSNIEEKRRQLQQLKQFNNDLSAKLPKYEKRVLTIVQHAQDQTVRLDKKQTVYNEQANTLAALRRSRIRQLTKYIFPVCISYDTSDSIEDIEFVGKDAEEEPPKRSRLHIGHSWINIDEDFSHLQTWMAQYKEGGGVAAQRMLAALGLAAQLAALLAWTLDLRLPTALSLSDYYNWRLSSNGAVARWGRLQCACAELARRTGTYRRDDDDGEDKGQGKGQGQDQDQGKVQEQARRGEPQRPVAVLHDAARAALLDEPALGKVHAWSPGSQPEWSSCGAAWAACAALQLERDDEPDPPEHLHWPEDHQVEEVNVGSPASGASTLVSSAAASLASLWRGWAK